MIIAERAWDPSRKSHHYVTFYLIEIGLPGNPFREILRLIDEARPKPALV